ncbi:hypothetical protein AB0N17_03055 [Streptomyces sp. NPDC051133]|uniref:hypothetical protein n=1 Tax=Streptomyces sp. NPDC051133 TaxID=3155521 RepID=UPI00341DE6C0
MRRTVVALLAAGLALAGCSSSTHGSRPDAKPSPSKTVSKAEQYLKVAHEISFNGSPSDIDLLLFPPEWCKALDAGHSVEWMLSIAGGGLYPAGDDWGTAKADAYTLIVSGTKQFCPRNLADVKEQLRASGGY